MTSRVGVVRTPWGLSFALRKMGIMIAACAQRLLWRSNEMVDLNSKEAWELSSVSRCARACVGAHARVCPCRELPATPFSCRDKSAASSVPSHQKYTRFWPRAMLSNSPGGGGEQRRPARWGPPLLGRCGHLIAQCQTVTTQGDKRPLRAGAVPPLSDWGLSGMRLCPLVLGTPGVGWGQKASSLLSFSPSNREVVTQCGRDSFWVRVGHLWGRAPGQGFRVQGVLVARSLPCRG